MNHPQAPSGSLIGQPVAAVWPAWLPSIVLVGTAAAVFVALWYSVLTGQDTLLGGDILYGCCLPWADAIGAHPPSNTLIGDTIDHLLPWMGLVSDSYRHFRVPLWNEWSMNGTPLLANDESAPFSPFTLFAVAFAPSRGMSLAMLAKLWVAGIGMALYVRSLDCRGVTTVIAGIAYATSSFVVVWLGWDQSSVAALLPWVFAATEWYLASGELPALTAVASTVALQFLAGNAETSLHLGLFLALYLAVRLVFHHARWRRLAGLVTAGILGTLMAGAQLLPFLDALQHSPLAERRAAAAAGLNHLPAVALTSWLIPNALGNPGIDHLVGRDPNYNEATGFAGVAMLLLAPIGLFGHWMRDRSVAASLGATALVSFGTAYGPLSAVVGRLPLLSLAPTGRMTIVCCFVVSALGALGVDALQRVRFRPPLPWSGYFFLMVGGAALLALAWAGVLLVTYWAGVDQLLPRVNSYIGFWVAVAAMSGAGSLAFLVTAVFGGLRRAAIAGFAALVLLEGALFAAPYNPRVPPSDVPPRSESIEWLRAHTGDSPIAGTGGTLKPETATLYKIHDVRVHHHVVLDSRTRLFWSHADPGYHDEQYVMTFERPGDMWLAAAGVRYVMTSDDAVLPGTLPVYHGEGVTISAVPLSRPLAFIATSVTYVAGPDQAAVALDRNPLATVALEKGNCCPNSGAGASGMVDVRMRAPGAFDIVATADRAGWLVVLQTFSTGWAGRVDGRPVAVVPADVKFLALPIPEGRHLIELRYIPRSFTVGTTLTFVGLGITGCLLVWGGVRRLRRRSPKAPEKGRPRAVESGFREPNPRPL